MDTLTFRFEVEKGFDAEVLAATVAERLSKVEGVEQSQAEVPDERFGVVEAVAVISAFILLTKAARESVEELKKFVTSLRKMVEEVNGLKVAVLDLAGEEVSLDEPDKVVSALQSAR
jgi:hypothetical protein